MLCHFGDSELLILTELVLSKEWLGDARLATAILILCSDSEDVLLPFNEFGDRVAGTLQGGGDGDPANLIILVVLLLQNVVQDLTASIVLRRFPVTDDGGVPDLIEGKVDWRSRFVCKTRESDPDVICINIQVHLLTYKLTEDIDNTGGSGGSVRVLHLDGEDSMI